MVLSRLFDDLLMFICIMVHDFCRHLHAWFFFRGSMLMILTCLFVVLFIVDDETYMRACTIVYRVCTIIYTLG